MQYVRPVVTIVAVVVLLYAGIHLIGVQANPDLATTSQRFISGADLVSPTERMLQEIANGLGFLAFGLAGLIALLGLRSSSSEE